MQKRKQDFIRDVHHASAEDKMKKYIMAGLLLASSVTVYAWEFPNNPDRYPSLGLNFSGQSLEGEREFVAGPQSAKQDGIYESGMLVLDGKFPVSNRITLNAAIGASSIRWGYDETPLLNFEENENSGTYFNLGIRFYLH